MERGGIWFSKENVKVESRKFCSLQEKKKKKKHLKRSFSSVRRESVHKEEKSCCCTGMGRVEAQVEDRIAQNLDSFPREDYYYQKFTMKDKNYHRGLLLYV